MPENPINWTEGSWNLSPETESSPSLLFCADWAPVRTLERPVLDAPGSLYSEAMRAELRASALRIVNVETTLQREPGKIPADVKEGPSFCAPAHAVQDLLSAGFDIALLANNHMGDYGAQGLVETREILEEAGLQTCGTGTSQEDAYAARIVEVGGNSIALVNFHEGEEGEQTERNPALAGWDLSRVNREIARQKAAGRLVIAVPHSDREFFPVPAPYGQRAFRGLIDAGADIVIGHHPHVPRGVEIYKGAPIIYSQGNFVFWSGQPGLMRRLGYMVRLYLLPHGELAFRLLPYRIEPTGLRLLDPAERAWLFSQLASVSGDALSPESVQAYWHAAMDAFSKEHWLSDATGMDHTFKCMRERNPEGIARLRTRFLCPAHYHFMTEGITRVLAGKHGSSPPEMIEKCRLWTGSAEGPIADLIKNP